MKIRKVLTGPVVVLVAILAVVLPASCGSSGSGTGGRAEATEEVPVVMPGPPGGFTRGSVAWGTLERRHPAAWPGDTPPGANSGVGFPTKRVARCFCLSGVGRMGSPVPNAAGHGRAC